MSDEEILTTIKFAKSWKHAKLRLVESLLFRFSYETNTEIHEYKVDLTDRFKNWQDLYKRLKAEVEEEELASNAFGFASKWQRPPVFTLGMHDWGR